MNKPILCLDFDGVIHSYSSGWKGADVIPDPPVEGAGPGLEDVTFPTDKPAAMVTIDDRALTFDGTWPTIDALLAFKPWNKR